MSESEWIDVVDNVLYLTGGEELIGIIGCFTIATFMLASLGAFVAPIVALIRLLDDWRGGKPSARAVFTTCLRSWAMFLPLTQAEERRSEGVKPRDRIVIYIILYICWIIGVTGLWAFNIVNGSFLSYYPESQHPGEVFTTTLAMFTVFATGVISAAVTWLNHKFYQNNHNDLDINSISGFDAVPFVVATAWFWAGLIDNLLGINNDVPLFPLNWFLIFCSLIWIVWSLARLLYRYALLRRLSNGVGRK